MTNLPSILFERDEKCIKTYHLTNDILIS